MAPISQGFLRPTTTPTPDELFDVWLPRLSGAELKVLLYIVRRTFGFKKDADAISLSQICKGITTRDGRVLDRGTGLTKTSAYKAVQRLEALGLILVDRAQFENGNNAINVYRLRFQAFGEPESAEAEEEEGDDPGGSETIPGVGQKVTQGGSETDPGVGQKDTPQQTDSQQTVKQESVETAPPPEEALNKSRKNGAGGAEVTDSKTAENPSSPETETPQAGRASSSQNDDSEVVRLLVEFGVWRSRAKQLEQALNLTPKLVTRACRALHEEAEQGASFTNPAAILSSRLTEGWEPPEVEEKAESGDNEAWPSGPLPKPKSKTLPPVAGRWGGEQSAHLWFEGMKSELRLQLPRETYDTHPSRSELADYQPPAEDQAGRVVIRLQNKLAYETVKHRLHKAIQRLVSSMIAGEVMVEYTAPHLENTEATVSTTGDDKKAGDKLPENQGVYARIQGAYTNVYDGCIQTYTPPLRLEKST
jgi:hypothetical protein